MLLRSSLKDLLFPALLEGIDTDYATAFQIQTSNDGSTWTTIYSTTTGTGGVQTLPVSGSGRYVRMYGTQRATQWGYSLWEFQVSGT